jgi:hypothetical protein
MANAEAGTIQDRLAASKFDLLADPPFSLAPVEPVIGRADSRIFATDFWHDSIVLVNAMERNGKFRMLSGDAGKSRKEAQGDVP